jgi:hypothetical protein
VYDETIGVLQNAIHKSKLGNAEKSDAIKRLTQVAQRAEKDFIPNANFDKVIEEERNNSWKYGGQTVFGKAKPPVKQQLSLF